MDSSFMKVATTTAGFDAPLDGLDALMRLEPVAVDHVPFPDALAFRDLWALLKRSLRYIVPEWRHLRTGSSRERLRTTFASVARTPATTQ